MNHEIGMKKKLRRKLIHLIIVYAKWNRMVATLLPKHFAFVFFFVFVTSEARTFCQTNQLILFQTHKIPPLTSYI